MDIQTLTQKLTEIAEGKQGGVVAVTVTSSRDSISTFGTGGLNQASIFPLASVTKVLTALLLVILTDRTDLNYTDRIDSHLPIRFSDSDIAAITLEQLALHTSGLPKLPTNLDPADESDPYADYTRDDLQAFLSDSMLDDFDTTQGKKTYSNVGYAVLGHVLEEATGQSFDDLLQDHICRPLGMSDTTVNLSAKQESRLAAGHNEDGIEVGRWHSQAMKGDGAAVTSATDMHKFISAMMPGGKFSSYTNDMHQPYQKNDSGLHQVLGWMLGIPETKDSNRYLAKGGESSGYQSFVGVSIDEPKAIGLLANCKLPELSAIGAKFVVEN